MGKNLPFELFLQFCFQQVVGLITSSRGISASTFSVAGEFGAQAGADHLLCLLYTAEEVMEGQGQTSQCTGQWPLDALPREGTALHYK